MVRKWSSHADSKALILPGLYGPTKVAPCDSRKLAHTADLIESPSPASLLFTWDG